jgi:hypothetical protein
MTASVLWKKWRLVVEASSEIVHISQNPAISQPNRLSRLDRISAQTIDRVLSGTPVERKVAIGSPTFSRGTYVWWRSRSRVSGVDSAEERVQRILQAAICGSARCVNHTPGSGLHDANLMLTALMRSVNY